MQCRCELVNHHLIPNSAVVTEHGCILQISVQHQHCENGLQSFDDSYLQHNQQSREMVVGTSADKSLQHGCHLQIGQNRLMMIVSV